MDDQTRSADQARASGRQRQVRDGKSTKAEASLPAKKYEPTEVEQAALDWHFERRRNNPAPAETYKITHDDGGKLKSIEINHPDHKVGTILAMDALGTSSDPLFNGLVAQLVAIGTIEPLKELELNFTLAIVQGISRATTPRHCSPLKWQQCTTPR
jgi:hypothetical protein